MYTEENISQLEKMCIRDREEDAGPTNHWMEPQGAYKMLFNIARGSYKGRTMYVIP